SWAEDAAECRICESGEESTTGSRVVFFFSSRRRHTRSYGDWSSDVCSSDLSGQAVGSATSQARQSTSTVVASRAATSRASAARRSEERRVGKECRSRGGQAEQQKKIKRRYFTEVNDIFPTGDHARVHDRIAL